MAALISFGCPACFQGDADAMWKALRTFVLIADLIDESHFSLRILACPNCGQRCLKIFTEIIDWTGGDDSMCSSILPLTDAEAQRLREDQSLDERTIESIDPARRYLVCDWAKGMPSRIVWMNGPLRVGWHD